MVRAGADQELLERMLRAARKRASLDQAELAARLGKRQSFVSKYESGERELRFLEVRDICGALGVSFLGFIRRFEAEARGASQP